LFGLLVALSVAGVWFSLLKKIVVENVKIRFAKDFCPLVAMYCSLINGNCPCVSRKKRKKKQLHRF
jgi:hypothetical protein